MLTREERENFDIDIAIQFCYDYIFPITPNRVLATHGDEISLITKDGEMICTYDSIQVPTYNSPENVIPGDEGTYQQSLANYVDDYLLILQDGMWGLIDYDGEIVLDPKYKILRFVEQDRIEIFD